MIYWYTLLAAVAANTLANIAFKKAMGRTPISFNLEGALKLLVEPWMWVGGTFSVILLLCYLHALKGIDLSVAYPAVTGLGVLGIALASSLFFYEPVGLHKILGMGLIISGVVLLKLS